MGTSGKRYQKLFVLLFVLVTLLCGAAGAFAEPEPYTVDVIFYQTDGTTKIPFDGNIENLFVYLEIQDISADEDADPVGWSYVNLAGHFDSSKNSYLLEFPTFTPVSNPNEKTDSITFNPDSYKVSYARLYHNLGWMTGTYSRVHDPYTKPNDTIEGYKFVKPSSEDITDTSRIMKIQKWDHSDLFITLNFDPEVTSQISADDGYWIRAKLKHNSGNYTYFVQKLDTSTMQSGANTLKILANEWRDNNGTVQTNEKFTGNEVELTVDIVKAQSGASAESVAKGEQITTAVLINDNDYIVNYVDGTLDISKRKTDNYQTGVTTCVYNIYLSEPNLEPALTPEDILGEASEFGIVANRYEQSGHTETNFAVNEFNINSNLDIDGSGTSPIPFYVANIENYLRFGQDTNVPADIFLRPEDNTTAKIRKDKESVVLNTYPMSQDSIEAYVNGLIQAGQETSAVLASKTTIKPVYSGSGYTVDTTDFPDGTTIYVDADGIMDSISAGGWHIKKYPNQSIVFNINQTGSIKIGEFKVNPIDPVTRNPIYDEPVNSTTSAMNGDPVLNQKVDDVILSHITFNATKATNVELSNASALFLLPNADYVTQENGAGWILAKGTFHSEKEWHFYRHTRSYKAKGDFTLQTKKTLTDEAGNAIPFGTNKFRFELYESNAEGTIPAGAKPTAVWANSSSGLINFQSITYTNTDVPSTDSPKTFYYVIREIVPDDAKNSGETTYAAAEQSSKDSDIFTKDGIEYKASPILVKVTAANQVKPGTNPEEREIKVTRVEAKYLSASEFTNVPGTTAEHPVFALQADGIKIDYTNKKYVQISAKKSWQNMDGSLITPAAGTKNATFRLWQKTEDAANYTQTDYTVVLDGTAAAASTETGIVGYESAPWTATFLHLPGVVGGKAVSYKVGEDALPGYTITPASAQVDDGGTLINTEDKEAGWSVKKYVDDAIPAADQQYRFVLQELQQSDGSWAGIRDAQNSGSAINFSRITYTTGGTHWYRMIENSADAVEGMVPDNTQYIIKVDVASNLTETVTVYKLTGDKDQLVKPDHTINTGVLTELSNGIEGIVFNNTMAKGSITLNGTKSIPNATGTDAKERTFGFSVNFKNNPDTNHPAATGTVILTEGTGAKAIEFTPAKLDYTYASLEALAAAGRATRTPETGTAENWVIPYTITENALTDETAKKEIGTAGPKNFTVTCTYTNNTNTIRCSSTTDTTPADFVNTERNTVDVPITLNKTLTGRQFQAGDIWNFTIEPYGDNAATAPLPCTPAAGTRTCTVQNTVDTTNNSASIPFQNFVFKPSDLADITTENPTGEKIYQYHLTETQVNPDNPVQNVDIDNQIKDFSVKVYLEGNVLKTDPASITGITFTNVYHTGTSVTLNVAKIITNWPSGTTEFKFQLKAAEGSTETDSLQKIREAANNSSAEELIATIFHNSATQTGNFPTLFFNNTDKTKTFKYIISEVVQTDKKGVSYSNEKYNVTITFNTTASDLTPIVSVQKEGSTTTETKTGTNNVFSIGSFTNEYKAVGKLNLSVTKGMNIWPTETPSYTFKLTNGANTTKLGADGLTVVIEKPANSVSAPITEAFASIPLTEVDAGQTYNFVLTEVVPADKQGVNYDTTNTHNIKVKVTDDGKGNVTPTVTVDNGTPQKAASIDTVFSAGTYTNTYEASGSLALTATKIVEDHDGKEDGERTFSFTLKYADGDKAQAATAAASTTKDGTEGAGTLSFTPLNVFSYDLSTLQTLVNSGYATGPNAQRTWTIRYQLTETQHSYKDLIQNSTPVDFTVTVTDDGKGKLNCTSDLSENKLSVVNKEWENTSVTISGTKVLWDYENNTALNFREGDTWTYTIKATGDNAANAPMPSQTNVTNNQGSFTFGEFAVTAEHLGANRADAVYNYTVTESGHISDVANDPISERHFKITVSKDASTGKITAAAAPTDQNFTDMDKELTFTNTQHDTKFMQLSVTKAMAKDHWPSGTPNFKFKLSGKNPEDTAKLQNVIPDTVTDKENYWIISDITELKRTVAFPSITFDQSEAGATYTFIVSEIPLYDNDHKGIGYDSVNDHTIEVTLDSNLDMTVKVNGETVTPVGNVFSAGTFTNTYSASGELTLGAKKTLSNPNGNTTQHHPFTFKIRYAADDAVAYTGSVTLKDGETKNIEFPVIRYDLGTLDSLITAKRAKKTEGKHEWTIDYILTEDDNDHDHLITNLQKFPFTVTITDDGQGGLTCTPNLDPENTVFVNTERQNAKLNISGTKRLVGREMKDTDIWSFTISAKPDEPSSQYAPLPENGATVNNDGSSITFGDIVFTPDDVDPARNGSTYTDYYYIITESGSVPSVDLAYSKGFRVRVSLSAEGNVQATLEEGVDLSSLLTFINRYHDKGSLHLAVKKTMKDGQTTENVPYFDFKLTGVNETAIEKIGADGLTARATLGHYNDLAVFSLIQFDETDMAKGDLIFNISEVFPGEDTETMMWNSVKYTDKTITVKVHLTDAEGLGKITPVVTVEGEDVELFTEDENDVLTIAGEFENEYIAVGDFTINSAKRIVDTDGDTSEDHTIPFELWHKDEHDKSMLKDKSAKVFISRKVTITDATTDEGKTKFDYPLRFTLEERPEQLDEATGTYDEEKVKADADGFFTESIPNLLKAKKARRVQTTDGKQTWEIEYVLDELTVVDQQLKPPDQTFDVILTVVDDGAGKLAVTQMKYRNIYKNPYAEFKTVTPDTGEEFTQFTFDDTEIFRNTERRDAAPVEIAGIKHLEGREMTGNDVWTFTIEGVPAEGETEFTGPLPDPSSVNNRGGLFEFNEIIFTAKQLGACDYTEDGSYYCQPKSYTYRVTESGTVEGVKNDTVKEFTVTVSEDKYGDVQVDIIDDNNKTHIHAVDENGVPTGQFLKEIEKQLTFTNTYGEDQISIHAKKNFKGDWPSGQEFTFTITPMDGAPALEQSSVTVSREEPERSFGTLSFKLNEITEAMKESGSDKVTYKYQIREVIPDNADETKIKYDSRVYTLTVTVRVNDQNQLVITTDPSASNGVVSFTFTNEIVGETTPTAPHFFRMPETGFSSLRPTVLDEQPKDISYRPLAWTLEIPSLDLMTEIVEVPMHGDEYPVTWLGESAGLLEGYALPGRGTSILTGHNHLNTTEAGPFALLKGMEVGDRIFVLDPQDGLQVFTVYANERIDGSDVQGLERIAERYENALTLLTCEDELPEGGYAHRRVIAAKPL